MARQGQATGGTSRAGRAAPVPPDAFRQAGSDDWFVLRLKPAGLARAETNLHRQGYPTFMPRRQVGERRRGRIVEAIRPLFPGYLFVQVAGGRPAWTTINSTYGVARAVALDGTTPSPVPGCLMASLFARCDGDTWRPEAEAFAPGTPVRVVAGPFASTLARIACLPDADRVYVLLDMMGQSVRAGVAIRDLEPV